MWLSTAADRVPNPRLWAQVYAQISPEPPQVPAQRSEAVQVKSQFTYNLRSSLPGPHFHFAFSYFILTFRVLQVRDCELCAKFPLRKQTEETRALRAQRQEQVLQGSSTRWSQKATKQQAASSCWRTSFHVLCHFNHLTVFSSSSTSHSATRQTASWPSENARCLNCT